MRALVLVLGLAGLATARAAAQEPAVVSGRVLDADTGAPVTGARIEAGGATVSTDADGRFRLGGLAPGAWRIDVTAIGYGPVEVSVDLAPGISSERLIRLTALAIVLPEVTIAAAAQPALRHEELVQRGTDLASAIDGWQGVVIRRSGGTGPASPQVRGSAPEEVVVTVDGFVVNDPLTGRADLSRLATRDIASVQVLPGAQSATAGTPAIGGVIAVQSRASHGGSAAAWFGSHGTGGLTAAGTAGGARGFLRVEELADAFPYTVPPNRGGGEGVRRNAGGTLADLAVRGTWGRWSAQGRVGGSRRGLPGPVGNETPHAVAEDRSAFMGVTYSGGTTLTSSLQYLRSDARDAAPPVGLPYASRSEGVSATLDWTGSVPLALAGWGGALVVGGNVRHDRYGGTVVQDDTRFTRGGVRALATLQPSSGSAWTVSPGMRIDGWTGSAGPEASARIDASWQAGATRIRGSVGSAVVAPPLADLFFREGVGIALNPYLRPERVDWEVELGVDHDWAAFGRTSTASVRAFYGRVEDMILWAPGVGFIWSPRNYDVIRRGVDGSVAVQPVANVRLEAQAAWTPVTYDVPDGPQVQYRPRATWSATMGWAAEGWGANARWRWVGERYPNPGGVNPRPAYGVLDLGAERALGAFLARADLRDVFDERAEFLAGYPSPGRTLILSIGMEWQ